MGKYYAINVPLQEAIDDPSYAYIFQNVITNIMDTFQPSAVVIQCGADSLGGDRLGPFNLSIRGHGECVRFIKSFKIPMMVIGGGGYTIRNVSRCWTYECSVLCGVDLPNDIPETSDYFSHFGPDYSLHPPIVNPSLHNANSRQFLDQVKCQIGEYLRYVDGAPSVQMQEIPPDIQGLFEGGNFEDRDGEVDEAEDLFPDVGQQDLDGFRGGLDGRRRRRGKEDLGGVDLREYYDGDRDHDRDGWDS
ncbi:Histone deacetylase 3 [Quaeritorhiza haematococci]|nr:Histone deacetylase 3 [Quaeritorhiza haematococci]